MGKKTDVKKGSERYIGSERQQRVHAYLKKGDERREQQKSEQQIKEQEKETMSDLTGEHGVWKQLKAAQKKVQAKENPEIKERLTNAKEQVKKKNTPKEVTAVFNLIEALNTFEGEISLGTDMIRMKMAGDLGEKLMDLYTKTNGKYDPNKKQHTQALATFNDDCRQIMKANYKLLAAEPTLWNYIKNKFNSAMKAIGLTPRGRILDTSLDSSAVMKDKNVVDKFRSVLDAKIDIEDEPDIDISLNRLK